MKISTSRLVLITLVCAGCGGGGGQSPDASVPDAKVANPVVVTVLANGAPVSAAPVVFQHADGTVDVVVATAADGTASHEVEADAMVTVGQGDPATSLTLQTIQGVKPGDRLTIGPTRASGPAGTVNVTLPGEVVGASQYVVGDGCALGSTITPTAVALAVDKLCQTADGKSSIFALAFVAPSSDPVAFAVLDGVTLTAGAADVTLPAWRTDVSSVTVNVTGAPPSATALFDSVVGASGRRLIVQGAFDQVALSGGVGTGTARVLPKELFQSYRYTALLPLTGGTGPFFAIERDDATLAAEASFDFGSFLSAPTGAAVTTGGDPVRPTLSWAAAPGGSHGDVTVADVTWTVGTVKHEWVVLAPPDVATLLALPALPAELAAWAPAVGAVYGMPIVEYQDVDSVAGYDALRNASDVLLGLPRNLPPNVTVRTAGSGIPSQ